MPRYLYVIASGSEESAVNQLPKEFEGPMNQTLARQQAEKAYGSGGRLFKEIPSAPSEYYAESWKRQLEANTRSLE